MMGNGNNWNDQAKTWAQQTIANEQHESRMLKEFELEQQYGDEFRAWKKERNHKRLITCLVALIIMGILVSAGLWFFDPLGSTQSSTYEPQLEKVEKANKEIQSELQESTSENNVVENEDAEALEEVEQYTEETNNATEYASQANEPTQTEENHQMSDGYVPAHLEENTAVLKQWENLGGNVSGCVEARAHDCMMKGHQLFITYSDRQNPDHYQILVCQGCIDERQFEPVIAQLDR